MYCAVCENEISWSSKVCSHCGHVIKSEEVLAAVNGVPMYTPKEKTCKYCGSLIDSETGICTYCDRSYNKGRTSLIVICVVSILLIFSVIFGALGWVNYSSVKDDTYWLDKYTALQKQVQQMPSQELLNFYKGRLSFYETVVVVLNSENNDYYHIYGCEDCKPPVEWAGLASIAESGGFKPCPKCTQ